MVVGDFCIVMRKVFQRISDPRHGDCFKCVVCSILDLDYDTVPNFIDMGEEWWKAAQDVFSKNGYVLSDSSLFNPKVNFLESPTAFCFDGLRQDEDMLLSAIRPDYGIDGYFLAAVYSPKYTNTSENPITHLHSVICDIDFNIVFDPHPDYAGILRYPYADLIGFNGIRQIDIIRKK